MIHDTSPVGTLVPQIQAPPQPAGLSHVRGCTIDRRFLLATPDQLMDVFQAAELFGVKPGTIRQWTSLGLISPLIRGELGKNKRSLYWKPDLVAYKQTRDGALEAAA